jgi:ATP-dependent Clp protease adaptor protein ClpS
MTLSDANISEDVETEQAEKTDEPPMYRVILHNDDFTPRDFVVEILVTVFNKNRDEATSLMLLVHNGDKGMIGVYPFDIAETRVKTATDIAKEFGFPLKITLEKE